MRRNMTLPSMGPSPPSRCPPLLPNVRRRSGRLRVTMPDFGELINHWGYFAIVLLVILGNVGLPVPEESILVLSGYLAWRGDLKLPLVIAVGIVAAAAGDIIGFWIGRRYGHAALDRYRHANAGKTGTVRIGHAIPESVRRIRGVRGAVRSGTPLHGRTVSGSGWCAPLCVRGGEPARRRGLCTVRCWNRIRSWLRYR